LDAGTGSNESCTEQGYQKVCNGSWGGQILVCAHGGILRQVIAEHSLGASSGRSWGRPANKDGENVDSDADANASDGRCDSRIVRATAVPQWGSSRGDVKRIAINQ
jgi:hypothetical protein